jgi:hypothetical protein
LGDLIVGIGTLALAGVTWQLAKSSERSLEALDLPFLLATPDRDRAYDLTPVFEEGEEPVDFEWALFVELVNLGAGPAILDGIGLTEDTTGEELVKEDWEVDWLIKAGDESPLTTGVPLRKDFPDPGSSLTLKVYYRSASGNRYVTLHQIRVRKPPHAHRLNFRRERLGKSRHFLPRLVGRAPG